jgi:hypothetical protein
MPLMFSEPAASENRRLGFWNLKLRFRFCAMAVPVNPTPDESDEATQC